MVPDDTRNNGINRVRAGRFRMLGARRSDGAPPATAPQNRPVDPAPARQKRSVVFVCIGNSCRSQMAEALARAYGSDVIEARSSGVSPATIIAPLTRQTLNKRNIDSADQFPKAFDGTNREKFEIAINMTGAPLRLPGARVLDWPVPDPIGQSEQVYQSVADQIEGLVMRLILDLRHATI